MYDSDNYQEVLLQLTNATKAVILAVVNSALGLAVAFGAPLTETQTGAIFALANAIAALIVLVTYKDSKKRIPDA